MDVGYQYTNSLPQVCMKKIMEQISKLTSFKDKAFIMGIKIKH